LTTPAPPLRPSLTQTPLSWSPSGPEFVEFEWDAVARTMRGTLLIDGRNALDGDAVRRAGLTYEGIGRRS